MGLSYQSTGSMAAGSPLQIAKKSSKDKVIALAGNPNVGKSTVFNGLTGLNQHTGNWPGKTVVNAQGSYAFQNKNFILVDVPGTYSLLANSVEEEVARDFICFGDPDATIIVADATCLERNLNLVLQILETTGNAVVCINLLDEAQKKKIRINLAALQKELGVPVVGTSAISKKGLEQLPREVHNITAGLKKTAPFQLSYDEAIERSIAMLEPALAKVLQGSLNPRWVALKLLDLDENLHQALTTYLSFDLLADPALRDLLRQAMDYLKENGLDQEVLRDRMVERLAAESERIFQKCVVLENKAYNSRDRKIDRLLTSKATGIPIMLALLALIFWLTITGANYPSAVLSNFLFWLENQLTLLFHVIQAPDWLHGMLISGSYRTLAWVVAVMLPPMAIFFPLFTLLEDSGYLPRVAFNMDRFFKKACAHGKQSLTMCMGFGCNACGVIGCRIIDSPRERLIAILTNNFVPCNGRLPPPSSGQKIVSIKTKPYFSPSVRRNQNHFIPYKNPPPKLLWRRVFY